MDCISSKQVCGKDSCRDCENTGAWSTQICAARTLAFHYILNVEIELGSIPGMLTKQDVSQVQVLGARACAL